MHVVVWWCCINSSCAACLCVLCVLLQEEAAAKLAKYRAEVQQLLSSIHEQASSPRPTPVDAQLLFRLADQLFASSINVSEFVELGGVPVVVAAVRANTRSLAAAQRGQQQQEIEEEPAAPQQQLLATAALPSMMQVRAGCQTYVCGSPFPHPVALNRLRTGVDVSAAWCAAASASSEQVAQYVCV